MEHFYRAMRKRYDLLMEDDKPAGGKWNYDSNNRNKFSKQDLKSIPEPKLFKKRCKSYPRSFKKTQHRLLWRN